MKVRDGRKYIKRSTAAQWEVQKPHVEYIRGLWGVQMYKSTDVRGVQENVAIEDCGNWFSVKSWADAGGDMEESRSPKPPTLGELFKSNGWLITKHEHRKMLL